ncbi:hypothetical protein ATANTOWER_026067 [Ataeniobius toweri]|uniref:Uncharacterized protein n=1 Tax=Ataeniobius toweri TaxID=208326 RepID=A0ABU7CDD2_9TELE|nr:hypothetical protein [Ataeniobius toweri]
MIGLADISDQDECQDNNGGCSHYCLDKPIGFLCRCPDDMKLVEDSRCEEVDVCLESDLCDQLCIHRNGSLTCECQEGYHMDPLTRECKAKGAVLVVESNAAFPLARFGQLGTAPHGSARCVLHFLDPLLLRRRGFKASCVVLHNCE